ncbi:MAG TPA: VIT and VWA domain-containing protein [Planctomycetota bacterium]|nr:VIT and VWA domain-containing protein [Planctomycetota bacterium]
MKQTILLTVLATAALDALAPCQGVDVSMTRNPLPGQLVEVTATKVSAAIVDGVAATTVQQTLQNFSPIEQEATFLLPLPPGATADKFSMTVDGRQQAGEVLDASKARAVYEEIVRKRRDPGLLEYMGQGLLRARIFPVPRLGKVEVQVRFSEVLPSSGGITTWRFPVRSATAQGRGLCRFSLLGDLRAQTPIKNVFSPLAGLDIVRDGDRHARVSLELQPGQVPAGDLLLHYGLAEQDFGAHVLTYKQGADGYFVMLLSPKREWPDNPLLVRSINLVLDTSGSMQGEKIQQARAAVRSFLQSLKPTDWFNVIPFSTEARPFFAEPQPASADKVKDALARVDGLEARGGTNIEEALRFALGAPTPDCFKKAGGSPTIVPITVFLTDGLPTIGTTDIDTLLAQAKAQNGAHGRIFVFGVGTDVNTRLLDTLAEQSRGDRDYVLPAENIELKTDALFRKLAGPVMSDVQVRIDGIDTMDVEPRVCPDLFVSSQLVVVGRYRGDGNKAIRLQGNVGGKTIEYVFEATFPAAAREHDWLPTLWAQRRVAALLDAIRMHGQQKELVDEVVRLGKQFGIVTPFTSHLILDEMQLVAQHRGVADGGAQTFGSAERLGRLQAEWQRGGQAGLSTAPDAPQVAAAAKADADRSRRALEEKAPETGDAAVGQSQALLVLREQSQVAAPMQGSLGLMQRRVGDRLFFLVQGTWVDQRFQKDQQQQVQKLVAFSDEYFALLRARPHLAPVFAFTTRAVVIDGNDVFEITGE